MEYINFSETKEQHVSFTGCAMKESVFFQFRWQDWLLKECNMRQAEISHTQLKGLDVTSCDIGGLIVDINALRGFRVTPAQALMLSTLLGLAIQAD